MLLQGLCSSVVMFVWKKMALGYRCAFLPEDPMNEGYIALALPVGLSKSLPCLEFLICTRYRDHDLYAFSLYCPLSFLMILSL